MKHDKRFEELDSLDKWHLVHDNQDIRGWPVRSATGDEYGRIEDMLVDREAEHVLAVRMDDGRLVSVDHLDLQDGHAIYREDRAASSTNYTKVHQRR
ncbi:hypothetical protein GRI38_11220 [Altererythrobacter aurantiacus]|uniref:PRC-barrel domain-containing protein n=1 Tax=Parapontixanthobacter aurantiacus TaxID=1463599 RepID=A0A844ZGB7_9SPHN|nr:hypothetical protein [Parapontixanthobacter aurantiacus]